MYSDDFDSMTNNLRDSAKGSNDGYDVAFPLTDCGANVGLLNKSMYNVPDATMIWQGHLRGVLTAIRVNGSLSVPSMFHHPETNVNIAVHVDDIFAVGDEADLKWMIEQLMKQCDLKNKIIGPNEHRRSARVILGGSSVSAVQA